MSTAYLGIGSNIGNPAANCLIALNELDRLESSMIGKVSQFYATEPFGYKFQQWFVNVVVEFSTGLGVWQLLNQCQIIEHEMGRVPTHRWGPRSIDIDILLYDSLILKTETLEIPHPLLHERRFVLQPLIELIPDQMHPGFRRTFRELFTELTDTSEVRLLPDIHWERLYPKKVEHGKSNSSVHS